MCIGREGGGGGKKYHLKPLEFLLGTSTRQDDVIVLGMLTQVGPLPAPPFSKMC
jgi:hypothetical protein